jgi:hypothetical protein
MWVVSLTLLMIDYRRHLRPFFLDPDLSTPTKYKKYYDFTCWLVIMSTYNYIVQPFIILTIWDSLRLWARVKVSMNLLWLMQFYVHIGIILSMIFFHSDGKRWLDSKLARKVRRRDSMSKYQAAMKRETSQNAGKGVHMVPPLPESLQEMKK